MPNLKNLKFNFATNKKTLINEILKSHNHKQTP